MSFTEKERLIQKQIQRIECMQIVSLQKYAIDISLSEMDTKDKNELYDAIEARHKELDEMHSVIVETASFED